MASSPKQKAKKRVLWSSAFLLGLATIFAFSSDPAPRAVSVAFAAILGVPFLLLSLFDLGSALRIESSGNFRASWPTLLLSELQGAFGAIGMAAGAFTVYHNVALWLVTPPGPRHHLLVIFILAGLLMVFVCFHFTYSAFVRPSKSDQGRDDV